jgi:hypothetical protein
MVLIGRVTEPLLHALAQLLERDVEHRHHEDSDRACGDMPPNTAVPTALRLISAAPVATTSCNRPRMKAIEVIITARNRICCSSGCQS